MVFSSLLFLFTFLPIFLIIYWSVPKILRNLIIVLGSLMFYAWGEPIYVGIMLFSIVLDYCCGRLIDTFRDHAYLPKVGLILSIIGNIGLLGFFKYSDFFISNVNIFLGTQYQLLKLALPIGISFYTFQTMSYTIDLYRGKVKVQKNIIDFATYVTMFPQLIAGPIVTYNHVEDKLHERKLSLQDFSEGSIRFIEGLGKKVLLANNIGLLWDTISRIPTTELSIITAWLGPISFGLQLYFDFSGYSDMAIGLGKMLGFDFPENFNYPYIAKSVTDFWRRWHITLGSWFREYIYIPLGGNRVRLARFYGNIFVVWFLTGFWHGAGWQFIFWGLFFGTLMIIERSFLLSWLNQSSKIVSHIYLLFVVTVSWVFFSQENLTQALHYLSVMLGPQQAALSNTTTYYLISNYAVILIIGVLFSTPLMKKLSKKLPSTILYIFYVGVLIFSTAYLVDATFNPFLYFRF